MEENIVMMGNLALTQANLFLNMHFTFRCLHLVAFNRISIEVVIDCNCSEI